MNIGDKFPDVLGKDQNGNEIKLSNYQGKKFIIYFYPKDNTPGCSAEAHSLATNIDIFHEMGYQIIGVSRDNIASHKKFSDKYNLPFPIVSDIEGVICEKAGVWQKKKMAGREYMGIVRTTFVCDPEGTVTDVITKVKTNEAAEQLIELLNGRGEINPAP